jgi:F-type H+-transporting ATPase subunit a
MASPVLHIKDAYYFEVPKFLWPVGHQGKADFPDVWVSLDPEFQLWEAERLHSELSKATGDVPDWLTLRDEYLAWKHDHQNFGKPLDAMLEESYAKAQQGYRHVVQAAKKSAPGTAPAKTFDAYVDESHVSHAWFLRQFERPEFRQEWAQIKQQAGDVAAYKQTPGEWAPQKIAAYNHHLSGRILIPQPPGARLKNLYEPESGFCVSKFLVIQVAVALILLVAFRWLARKIATGGPPRGRLWNLLELFLVYLRDNVARTAIGKHDGDRFVPLLWTIFMFVLACNLCGMIPWVGTPTGSLSVTSALAAVTFLTGVLSGMRKFGVAGFFANQVPSMSLPLIMAIFIKPLVLVLELIGLCIKHAVLAIRLLANMVAGHLVLLGIMGLAFGATAAASFVDVSSWLWAGTAVVAIVGSTLFSCLELFVAFLQAYIFTFLSALFIGAAVHHH